MIEWGVIPIAGRGTRMLPAAAAVDKALLPVGLRPMLHWTLAEACAAGLTRLAIVERPEQSTPRAYVERALAAVDGRDGEDLARLGEALSRRELRWVRQPHPVGIADAFLRCHELTGDGPFLVLLPDNWFTDGEPAAAQIARAYLETGMCTLGLTRVPAHERALFGNVGGVELEPMQAGRHRIVALQDKRPGAFAAEGDPDLRACGRYAVDGRFYEALRANRPTTEGEWDDVPAFQQLIGATGLAGQTIDAVHYDVGNEAGYLAAAAYLHRRATTSRGGR